MDNKSMLKEHVAAFFTLSVINGGKPPSERRDENKINFMILLLLFIKNV
jgi:hypothetical protein